MNLTQVGDLRAEFHQRLSVLVIVTWPPFVSLVLVYSPRLF